MQHFEDIKSLCFRMLHAFAFKFSWLPEGVVNSVVEKIDALTREDVSSMVTYQMIVLDLAADCVNPGRMMMINFFSESVKEHLVKKMRDVTERVRESELVTMVQDPIYRAGKKVSKVDKGDRPRKDDMSGIYSSTATDQAKSGDRK